MYKNDVVSPKLSVKQSLMLAITVMPTEMVGLIRWCRCIPKTLTFLQYFIFSQNILINFVIVFCMQKLLYPLKYFEDITWQTINQIKLIYLLPVYKNQPVMPSLCLFYLFIIFIFWHLPLLILKESGSANTYMYTCKCKRI